MSYAGGLAGPATFSATAILADDQDYLWPRTLQFAEGKRQVSRSEVQRWRSAFAALPLRRDNLRKALALTRPANRSRERLAKVGGGGGS